MRRKMKNTNNNMKTIIRAILNDEERNKTIRMLSESVICTEMHFEPFGGCAFNAWLAVLHSPRSGRLRLIGILTFSLCQNVSLL